jgi:hypothetical protein
MSLAWVIAGSISMLILGVFMVLITIFAGAGIGNKHTLTELQNTILGYSIYWVPLICFGTAGLVIYLYKTGAGSASYYWYLLPVVIVAAYIAYAVVLSK